MGLFSKDIKTMDDLLLHGLRDIYYADNRIVKSLPKLIEMATNRDLTKGLSDHLEETKNADRAAGSSLQETRPSSRRALNVQLSMASSRRRMRSPERSPISRFLTPRSSAPPSPSSITRSPGTAH